MNAEQRKILIAMQDADAPVVSIVSKANARTLINDGYVRAATVQPAPTDGQAVNLTAKGRGYGGSTTAPVVETGEAAE